jgi:ankyrin repeat protein
MLINRKKIFLLLFLTSIITPLIAMNWWPEPKEARTKLRQEQAKQEEERKQAATKALADLLLSAGKIDQKDFLPEPRNSFIQKIHGLLKQGADANEIITFKTSTFRFDMKPVAGTRMTFLQYAIALGIPEIVQLLLNHGANVQTTPSPLILALTVKMPSLEIISLLLERGANSNIVVPEMSDRPLIAIALENPAITPAIIQKLIAHGGNIKYKRSEEGFTALMDAENPEIVKLLLDLNADPEVRTNDGQENVISQTIMYGNWPKLKVLLEHNSNVNIQDARGITPLMVSATVRNAQMHPTAAVAEQLLLAGADVNAKDRYNNTPLIHAVHQSNAPMVELLLVNGADQTIINNGQQTAAILANERNNQDIIALLQNPPPRKPIRLLSSSIESERKLYKHLEQQETERKKAAEEYKEQAKKAAQDYLEKLRKDRDAQKQG